MSETEFQMVQRHIREGKDIVARQEALVHILQVDGLDSMTAEELLTMFRKTLADHQEHMDRLQSPV